MAAPAWKRRRENPCSPETPTAEAEWTLPTTDLLLEIVARSDTRTLIRCAAACKLLRRDILCPSFIHRVTKQGGIVPPWIIAHLNTHDDQSDPPPPLSLVHPSTPAAVLFAEDHLSTYLSRLADDLLSEHLLVTSRRGLALLRRRRASKTLSNLCVYDPITGDRTFLPDLRGMHLNRNTTLFDRCVLLTAKDGIGCSFLLFVPHRVVTWHNRSGTSMIEVHIATSMSRTWTPVAMNHECSALLLRHWNAMEYRQAVVLHGGVIHWLARQHGKIVTYNACTMEFGTINLPSPVTNFKGRLHLGSHDRRSLLRLFGADGFNTSVWNQLPSGDWSSEAVTSVVKEEKLQSLDPADISTGSLIFTTFKCSGEGSNAVLLRIYQCGSVQNRRFLVIVLDLETKEMSMQEYSTTPCVVFLEVDLQSHLRAMKIFPWLDSSAL